jgi:hypothetical protein
MLPTGSSAREALALLKNQGAEKIQFVCIIARPLGIERVQSSHPDVEIYHGNDRSGIKRIRIHCAWFWVTRGTAASEQDSNPFASLIQSLGLTPITP